MSIEITTSAQYINRFEFNRGLWKTVLESPKTRVTVVVPFLGG